MTWPRGWKLRCGYESEAVVLPEGGVPERPKRSVRLGAIQATTEITLIEIEFAETNEIQGNVRVW